MLLSEIYSYPIKSCKGNSLGQATVTPRGLQYDRRWLVIDAQNRFITGRTHPALVLMQVAADDVGIEISAPKMPQLSIAQPDQNEPKIDLEIWREASKGIDAGEAAAAWFSQYLQQPVRLVFQGNECVRAADPVYAQQGDEVSFADGFPLLLISQAALDELNRKLSTPASMARFRPNLVISGSEPHAEDLWKQVKIGHLLFDVVKSCTRCVFTTIDPLTGERDADNEPLKTLKSYRRSDAGITFGQNLIPRSTGQIQLGDQLTVLA